MLYLIKVYAVVGLGVCIAIGILYLVVSALDKGISELRFLTRKLTNSVVTLAEHRKTHWGLNHR